VAGNHNSGRPRTRDDNDPLVQAHREEALHEYYDNKEYKLKYARIRHRRIKDYMELWDVDFKTAVREGAGRYVKVVKEKQSILRV